jgi:hypothetical protein
MSTKVNWADMISATKKLLLGCPVEQCDKSALLATLLQMRSEYEDGDQPYPDDVSVVAGHVVVATLDPGKEYSAPLLRIYTPEKAKAWIDAFREALRQDKKLPPDDQEGWISLLYETEPR